MLKLIFEDSKIKIQITTIKLIFHNFTDIYKQFKLSFLSFLSFLINKLIVLYAKKKEKKTAILNTFSVHFSC